MNIDTKIKQIRDDSGLTQDEFAAKLHVTRQAVSRWENGETTPPVATIKRILEIFRIEANSFFFGSVCQSCSCPLAEVDIYGTNADGGISSEYCGHCLAKGKFISYQTLGEAIADSVNFAEAAGLTKEQMLEYAKATLPTLKRWSI